MSDHATTSSIEPGLSASFSFVIPENKTVPHLFPEAEDFASMPAVFATGFMVGLVEWTCMQALRPHLDWPAQQSVGTDVKLSHTAATPPGLTVTVQVRLDEVRGKRLLFSVSAHDGVDEICRGTHERYLIDTERFNARVALKRSQALSGG